MYTKSDAKTNLVLFLIATLILSIVTIKKFRRIIWTKPVMSIDSTIVNKNICYHIFKSGDDYVSLNTINGNGLFDIDTGKTEILTAFSTHSRIKSIHGYSRVKGGYVNFNDQVISYSGGNGDVWQDKMLESHFGELEKDVGRLKTSPISIPLTRNELHKTISFNVKFDVVYPKLNPNKQNYSNIKETILQKYELYIITQDEMNSMKEYKIWENRGSHIFIFIVFLTLTLISGFIVIHSIRHIRKY